MKLCFLAGANSIHSHRWVKYFADIGHDVHWISFGVDCCDTIPENVKFYDIRPSCIKVVRPLKYFYKLKALMKQIKPDLVHAHQVWLDGVLGALSSKVPLVITPWGSDVLLLPERGVRNRLSKYALQKADLITCDGDNTNDAVVRLGVVPDSIKRIIFGVDVRKYRKMGRASGMVVRYDVGGSLVVVSIRNLKPLYDVETLVRAIPSIVSKVNNAKFLIAGDGPQKIELQSLAKQLGVEENVNFLGSLHAEDVVDFYNVADVYVSTSLSDSGLAASTAEAMSCELPVVVTDSGDNRNWVHDAKGGYVIRCSDAKALAEHVIELLTDEAQRKCYGEFNRSIIEEQNNYYKEMEKMDVLYRSLGARYDLAD